MEKFLRLAIKRVVGIDRLDHQPNRFPDNGYSALTIWLKHIVFVFKLQKQHIHQQIGWLRSYPSLMTRWIYALYLPFNPNHVGSYTDKIPDLYDTTWFEYKTVKQMADLFRCKKQKISGYVTSGATEGNIFSVWMGREFFKANYIHSLCLVKTSLTHFSVDKAARLTNINQVLVPINERTWTMDPDGLYTTIVAMYKSHHINGFLLPITLGYTQTGTNDNIKQLLGVVQKLETEYKVKVFVWIDAATNGLVLPFIDSSFAPFQSRFIQTCVVDFHKFGQIPYPAGIILYRKNLQKHIVNSIPYLPEKDTTLLGSRPGLASISIWTTIQRFGTRKFKKIIHKQLLLKNEFLDRIQKLFPQARVITDKNSVSCGIIFRDLVKQTLPLPIEKKYGLFGRRSKYLCTRGILQEKIYKFYFFPHTTKSSVLKLLFDLSRIHSHYITH